MTKASEKIEVTNEEDQSMPDTGIQVCPICGVKILKIIGGDRVMFSAGPPGTRAILWARVCQYTEKRGCINRDKEAIGNVKPQDYYQSEV